MRTILLQVTEEDIRLGQELSEERARTCPVARALERRGFDALVLGMFFVYYGVRYKLPPRAVRWIDDADMNRNTPQKWPKPTAFRVRVPD